ncbi:MAG: glycosyltransferase family 2 protein [Chloroflexi bacterium]|nr:glycosyltransferase family 2 protein [Chloroflexota bacterium]
MFLSIVLIARDEERYIGGALGSAAPLADELLVVLDPRTTDRTAEIAREHGARVVEHEFVSFPRQRNAALALSRGEWVLFLDADERITPELAAALRQFCSRREHEHVGYWLPRHNLYFGQLLHGGGWYPDGQLRLLRRDSAHYDESRLVHELVQIDGSTGELPGHLLHINIESWPELHTKQRRYALAEAQTLALSGVRAKWRNLLLQPLREVNRRFVTWHGYRDGTLGLALALTMGYYELIKYVHLKALERSR